MEKSITECENDEENECDGREGVCVQGGESLCVLLCVLCTIQTELLKASMFRRSV